jgi:hypothetical protein
VRPGRAGRDQHLAAALWDRLEALCGVRFPVGGP